MENSNFNLSVDGDDDLPTDSEKELLHIIAYFHLRYGEVAQAIPYLNALVLFKPNDPIILRSLALAYFKNGNHHDALIIARQLLLLKEQNENFRTASELICSLADHRIHSQSFDCNI